MANNQRFTPISTKKEPERALLVGVDFADTHENFASSMLELERLCTTDDALVVATITQKLDKPYPKTFVGSGKVEEIAHACQACSIDVVVFNNNLTPSQQSNLEKLLPKNVKVIDRCALILDIFGKHATTKEGRIQVQRAQLEYVLPRLRGMWSHLMGEQTRGGIGSRFGQGESQLEVDRRLIRKRITHLTQELVKLERQRQTKSKLRYTSGNYRVALAGYTNAGKSTLLKALTCADVYIKDELFATLDPTTRALKLLSGREIILSDTIGFIQDLPTTLIESFKSTLAEIKNAHLILIVLDASDANFEQQLASVQQILAEINADDIEQLLVFNKCDCLEARELEHIQILYPHAVYISAMHKEGFDALLDRIESILAKFTQTYTYCFPYTEAKYLDIVHRQTRVLHEEYQDTGIVITAEVSPNIAHMLEDFKMSE